MQLLDNHINPFTILCQNYYERTVTFTPEKLIDYGNAYYYLTNTSYDYIARSVINKCDGIVNETYHSRFEQFGSTTKFCIETLEVSPPFENRGIMTIMFCDVMLAILNSDLSNHHIELKFINTSDLIKDGKIVNVYHNVIPSYELTTTYPTSPRISLEGERTKSNIKFYQDIYKIFPIETRAEDIAYYSSLRNKKLMQLHDILTKEGVLQTQ